MDTHFSGVETLKCIYYNLDELFQSNFWKSKYRSSISYEKCSIQLEMYCIVFLLDKISNTYFMF